MYLRKKLQKRFNLLFILIIFLGILVVGTPISSNIVNSLPDLTETSTEQENDIEVDSYKSTAIEKIGNYGWDDLEVVGENVFLNDLKVIIDNDDNSHIIWSGRIDSDWFLHHKIRYTSNGSWSEITIIGETTSDFYGLMDAKLDDFGQLHICWLDDTEIKYRYYSYGSWSEEVTIDVGVQPRLDIISNDQVSIVYRKREDYYSSYYWANMISLHSWDYQIIPEFGFSYYSDTARNYDYLMSEYQGSDQMYLMTGVVRRVGNYFNYQYLLSYYLIWKENDSTPISWSGYYNEYSLESSTYHLAKPLLLSSSTGKVHFIYPIHDDNTYKLGYQKLYPTGPWTAPLNLTSKSAIKCNIVGVVDNSDRLVLMWNYITYPPEGGTSAGLYMKTLSSKTGQWSGDFLVNPGHGYTQYPSLAADSEGNLHAAWLDQNDTSRTLYYRKGWVDTDEDGLMDFEERDVYFTDPYNDDSDSDMFTDGAEYNYWIGRSVNETTAASYCNNPDVDNDTMIDGWEYNYQLDPYLDDSLSDFDSDLLTNLYEYQIHTLPNNNDTDNDAVSDYDEAIVHLSDPLDTDSDDDKLDDGLEINILTSNPLSGDTDNDTMSDWYEWAKGLNILVNDSGEDPDGEGLINYYEHIYSTHPFDNDTEDDGLTDYEEVMIYHTKPLDADGDYDGLNDIDELFGFYVPDNPFSNGTGYIFTDPNNDDTDEDSVNDYSESYNKLDPNNNDSDSDLMIDGYEWIYRFSAGLNASDPSDALTDIDGDGLTNLEESYLWTHPNNSDTDGDRFSDLEELFYGCDPRLWDTDGDGLSDYNEVIVIGTNVTNPDTDADGLNDYQEVHIYFSDPLIIDTDKDTLIDGDEVHIYNTSPAKKDTDDDLVDDNDELDFGSDPTLIDTDFDGMDDYFEWLYDLDPRVDDSQIDTEGDGIVNGDEYQYDSNPLLPDTDFDNVTDYDEIVIYFTRPDHFDTDLDGLSDYVEIFIYNTTAHDPDTDDDRIDDGEEISIGTNPLAYDTDGDGISDGQELDDKTDPLDPSDNRVIKRNRLVLISFSSIIGAMIIYYFSPFITKRIRKNVESEWVREGIRKRQQKSTDILSNDNSTTTTEQEDKTLET
ncbi:MAG: hypothetical protein FK733_15605 [Asgard group archaeon]|nr:hypothetical protein [Asgard group archaeon]